MKKCVMIYNAKSGKNKTENLLKKFYEIIEQYGYNLEIIFTKRKGHAISITKKLEDDIDLVIAAGGDGTFNEVVTGNLKREKKLLISQLPLGTTNDVGTMYGYDQDYINDLNMLMNGTIKNIDVCMINGRPFSYFAGVGNFLNVTYETPRKLKEKYGRLGYIIYGIKELRGRLKIHDIKYVVDGNSYEGKYSFIFITNSSRIAGINNIYPDIKLDDNKFEVLMCKVKSKVELIKTLYELKTKDIRNLSNCEYYETNKLEITFKDIPNSWCLDGEEYKHSKNKFKFTINKEINMLVPNVNLDKLFINE